MTLVTGRFAEIKGYLLLCATVFNPGAEGPVFQAVGVNTELAPSADLAHAEAVIEEGRRQIDGQAVSLARIQTNAAGLATIALVELGFVANGANSALGAEIVRTLSWWASAVCVIVGLLGATGILFSRWVFGKVGLEDIVAIGNEPRRVANLYLEMVRIGEITIAARTTLTRDAVLFLWLGAVLFVVNLAISQL